MMLKKQGFPDDGELVLCTVTSVQYNSVFAKLDEYGKSGMIHISEVSPGRIRNIRDYVSEGRKIVCKVLKVHTDRGHIDLSLRRVNESQKKNKMNEIKLEQKAEKIIEMVAEKLSTDKIKLYSSIISKVTEDFEGLYHLFEEYIRGEVKLETYINDKKALKEISEIVEQRIKLPEVEIKGKIVVRSYEPDGIEIIKKALNQGLDVSKENITITYGGGGKFNIRIVSEDYKEAEEILKNSTEAIQKFMEKSGGTFEFTRVEA